MGLVREHAEAVAVVARAPAAKLPPIPSYTIGPDDNALAPVRRAQVSRLLVSGASIADIARATGMSEQTASRFARDPQVQKDVQDAFKHRRNALMRKMDGAALEAVQYLRDTLNDTTVGTRDRIRCAAEILDRSGYGRGVKLDVHNAETGTTIEIEDVAALSDAEVEQAAILALARRDRLRVGDARPPLATIQERVAAITKPKT